MARSRRERLRKGTTQARDCGRPLAYGLVDFVKSLLVKGGMTDFQVRQRGIRRTWKSVVPLNQQPVTRRVVKLRNGASHSVSQTE